MTSSVDAVAALPAQRLPESQWRSFGGYLDYEPWPARERFVELDDAIARAEATALLRAEVGRQNAMAA